MHGSMNHTIAAHLRVVYQPLADQLGDVGLPAALAVLALAFASLWLFSRSSDDWAKLPGPPVCNRLVGHLPKVGVKAAHRFFQDSCQRYGAGGLFRLRVLHMKVAVVCDPNLVQAVVSRKNDLPKAPEIYDGIDALNPSGSAHRSFFNTHDYEEWKLVRKTTAPAFSLENTRKAFPVLLSITNELSDALAAKVAAGQDAIDVTDAAMRVTLDTIGAAGYGYDFKARTYAECELFEVIPPVLEEVTMRGTNPLRRLMHTMLPFLPNARRFQRCIKTCHKWWHVLVKQIKDTDLAAADAAKDNSLRVCLARLPVSDEVLCANVSAYLVAGFETTAQSIAWTLYEIAANPAVQARVAAELAAAGLLGPGARQLEFNDLAELRYLNCVLKEAMRLHPVASLGTVRKATRDISLGGYRLAKGTILWVPFIAVMTSNHSWVRGEDFWPERWDQAEAATDGAASTADGKAAQAAAAAAAETLAGPAPTPVGHATNPTKTYLPFSDGPRDCIGQNLALMEARAVLAMLVGRFELSVAPRMGSREDVRAAEVMKLTMQVEGGIHLRFKPRQ